MPAPKEILHIIRSTEDPTEAPPHVGIHWINTVTKIEYISVGTSVVSDWKARGEGSGGGGTWGSIIGTLSNQVDLNNALNLKADKNNVLELNNTVPFTPLNDHEPATKKYVDDILGVDSTLQFVKYYNGIPVLYDTIGYINDQGVIDTLNYEVV